MHATQPIVISWFWPRVGSIAGGTRVDVRGSGFATDSYAGGNLVFLGDIPCEVERLVLMQNS